MASDITINRGTTYTITHVYKKNGVESSDGATLFFTVKTDESDLDDTDSTALVSKNVAMSGATNVVTLDPDDTQDIEPGKYWFDLKVLEDAGPIYRVAKGRCTIDASPTNRLSP